MKEGKLHHFEKGEAFVYVGHVARYIGYIQSGTMKYAAYSANGAEHIVGMEFAGEFVADFPFSLSGKTARISIIAVTPCDIYCFPVKKLSKMAKADKALLDLIARSTEALFSTVYDRYIDLHRKSPQQRYDELLSTYPDIFTWFSLKDIASYLNITPTHLSRLRKNIKKN